MKKKNDLLSNENYICLYCGKKVIGKYCSCEGTNKMLEEYIYKDRVYLCKKLGINSVDKYK